MDTTQPQPVLPRQRGPRPEPPTVAVPSPVRTAPLSQHSTTALPATALVGLVAMPPTPPKAAVRGRRAHELAPLATAFLFRRRRHELPADHRKAQALISRLRPGSLIHSTSAGLTISHQDGLTAIVHPRQVTADLLPSPADLLTSGPSVALGVVFHAGPHPGQPVHTYLSVHVGQTEHDPRRALHGAMNRVRKQLEHAGMAADPMTDPATLTALAHATGGYLEVREDWRFWRTGGVAQACFRVDGTPHGALVTDLLTHTPGVAATVAWNVCAQRQDLVLRLAAISDDAVDAAARTLAAVIAPVRLVRLDGAHRAGVAATMPIGGTPR